MKKSSTSVEGGCGTKENDNIANLYAKRSSTDVPADDEINQNDESSLPRKTFVSSRYFLLLFNIIQEVVQFLPAS